MKKNKTILALSFFIVTLTFYSIFMLIFQHSISNEIHIKINQIQKNHPEIETIDFRGISLSPFFFINKNFYIDNLFFKIKNILFDIQVKKIEINDFFKINNDFFPKNISSESIDIPNIEMIKEAFNAQNKNSDRFSESILYFLDSPRASFQAKYQSNQYSIDFRFFLKNKLILDSSYYLNNFYSEQDSPTKKMLFNLKYFKLNIENIPLNIEKAFPQNKPLQEVFTDNYKKLLIKLNINYNSSQDKEKEPNLNANIEIQNVANIKIYSHFIFYNLNSFKNSSLDKTLFIYSNQNFLEEYYKNEAKRKGKSIEEIKDKFILENNLLLVFLSSPVIEKAILEINKFVKDPKTLSISINPENPITIESILKQAKEDYFGLLKQLNIKFQANVLFNKADSEGYFH